MQQTVSLLQVRRVAETTLPTRCPRVVFENRVARSNRREEGDRGSSRRTAREVPRPVSARAAHSSGRASAGRARRRRGDARHPTRRAPPARLVSPLSFLSKLASADRSRSRFREVREKHADPKPFRSLAFFLHVSRTNSARRRRRSASCRAPSIRCTWRTATCARGWMPPPPGRS